MEPSGPLDVLVIEDDMPIQRLLAHIVNRMGFSCESADDGAEGLKMIIRRDPRVIILDLLLPRTNGFEVLRHLHAQTPELLKRVIVATAAAESTYAACKELELTRSLFRKPIDIDALVAEIEACHDANRPATRTDRGAPPRVTTLRREH